jgi:hypothetical protein
MVRRDPERSHDMTKRKAPNRYATVMTTRRLLAPWRVEKLPGGFVVRDANSQALAYVYSRATETDALQAKVLTEDEARRSLSTLLGCPNSWATKNDGPEI